MKHTKTRNKISRGELSILLHKKQMSQLALHVELEKRGIYRSSFTVHRWCAGRNACRDLFVCKHIAEILEVDLKTIINCFK